MYPVVVFNLLGLSVSKSVGDPAELASEQAVEGIIIKWGEGTDRMDST